jgi:four helix bundle protein
MAELKRFEDLIAWQKARVLTREVYKVTRSGTFARDFGLKDQIQRASVSVMSNIAEGFERGRPGEFFQFLNTAKGSCGEVRSELYVAYDAGHVKTEMFDNLYATVDEVGRLVHSLRLATERRRDG